MADAQALFFAARHFNLTADPFKIFNITEDHIELESSMIIRLEEHSGTELFIDDPDQARS
jgi:hypothetical protein